jgi:hypothetical protein
MSLVETEEIVELKKIQSALAVYMFFRLPLKRPFPRKWDWYNILKFLGSRLTQE